MYDFSITTEMEDNDIKSILWNAKKNYTKEIFPIGLAQDTYSTIYKAGYILNNVIINLNSKTEKPYNYLATAIAYGRKGAYFRQAAIKYYEKYFKQYTPMPPNIFIFNEHFLIIRLAELYEKEYEFENAYNCIKQYLDKGNEITFVEIIFLGKLLEKIDINRCVEFYKRISTSHVYTDETKLSISNALNIALEKQSKGYVYRPRRQHIKPFSEESELLLNKQAIKYINYLNQF